MKLLVDVMCGGVVSYLRMCNHDTVFAGDRGLEADDDALAVAHDTNRTIVTRDRSLANRADESVLLESRDVEDQLTELATVGLDLTLAEEPEFCGRCNGPLERVGPAASTPEYAPNPTEFDVQVCRDCGQYFWRGSHWERVAERLSAVRDAVDERETNT
ncbi:Mut7-C RNAse domain-containing protein [Natrinema halophilum]|uniref:Mut7-C RNAse domain-containing protein n=1 Tax=Natrinema halophilum TaxID=1699371 RepID=A0A7D5KJJ5_9EURY|nr:Mut7-C RNAse domain-containing protein [Natrinema halophilum]QLG48158.1 Mut7-C RNAse domain-containing protein [Natrinema halophilum]